MSWTETFPVMSDEMLDQYAASATADQKTYCSTLFEVQEIHNPRATAEHLVAISLFWKRDTSQQGELPAVTRETLVNATKLGLAGRFDPWTSYVLPILDCAGTLREARPEVALRIYLANDMAFLVEDLVNAGCEVHLMKTSSIRHNPGALWRFLAIEGSSCPVTISDADHARWILADIERTEAAVRVGVAGWRVPYDFETPGYEGYRPINASQFGLTQSLPMRSLMEAFIWHNKRNSIPKRCRLVGLREIKIAGTDWPDYGFDEWFLLAVLYPRMAFGGILTFMPWDHPSLGQFFALDIEYCSWANPASELIYYPKMLRPWSGWTNKERLKVRPETTVVKRARKRIGAAQGIFNHVQKEEIEHFPSHHGDLFSLLDWANRTISAPWWIDLNPQLRLSSHGSELFLDRRHEKADVVFCGYYFLRITPATATWARSQGLDSGQWAAGGILKVPKLEGPMTLWNSSFAARFHAELLSLGEIMKPEILLRAWMDLNKAFVHVTTAKEMGWGVR
jgi:hypothetical protein